MKLKYLVISIILFLAMPLLGFAHPGRTDSSGCHTCRTNCPNWGLSYGEYHCHRAKTLPQPEEPIKSHYGEEGSGYTEPAPEYKAPTPTLAPTPQIKVSPSKSSPQSSPQEEVQKEDVQKEQKIENPEVKSVLTDSQIASVNEVILKKPKLNLWQRILRWFGFAK